MNHSVLAKSPSPTRPFQLRLVRVLLLCSLVAGALGETGCTPRMNPADLVPPPPPPVEHTISYPGETLGAIARWYTGETLNWTAIRDANPGLDERKLKMGDIITVPGPLVIKREPLPKNFSTQAAPSKSSTRVIRRSTDNGPGSDRDSAALEASASAPASTPPAAPEKAATVVDAIKKSPTDNDSPRAATESTPTVAAESSPAPTGEKVAPEPVAANPAVVATTTAPAAASGTPAATDKRAKTRDDLLKELLDEY